MCSCRWRNVSSWKGCWVFLFIASSGHLIKLNHLQKQKKVGACQSHQEQYFKSYLYKTNKRKISLFIASKYANDSYFTLKLDLFLVFSFICNFNSKQKLKYYFPFKLVKLQLLNVKIYLVMILLYKLWSKS